MSDHTSLVNEILIAFGARTGLRLWKANAGAAQTKTGAIVRFGTPGQADIIGIRVPYGQLVAIEVKTGRAKQSTLQRKWQRMIEKHGGVYVLARSAHDVEKVLG